MNKATIAIIVILIVVIWLFFGGFDVIGNLLNTFNILHLFGLF